MILEKVKALKEKSLEIKEEMKTKAGIQKQFMEELQKADTTLSRFVELFKLPIPFVKKKSTGMLILREF